ncbi:hypothetical protein XO12_09990 [Marinitoga sp. 1154]|uniref:carboxypeptidase regulatory-like domain-containing protein n=1 Tax=Marinitoga sp. 1154 TaxID=1643335 RepID=UPI001586E673|nr:carboxypeptidase regulatory-like domain-containing protein [Marinitoga sp. 1154]NUV00402.1 hypothetical protein [Marinitoga sp. 1154]
MKNKKKYLIVFFLIVILLILNSCVNLRATSSIQGHINLKFTDQLEGTLVKVKGTNITTKTDPDGNFIIKNLNYEKITLQISRDDYEAKEINVNLIPGSVVSVNTSLVYKYGILKGSISGTSNDNEINIILKNINNESKSITQKVIKGSGIFFYDKIEPGEYILEVESSGYDTVKKNIVIIKNEITEVEPIILENNLGDLEGKITLPFTEELSNTQIIIKDKNKKIIDTLTTDNNGKFSKKGLTKGEYTLEITKEKYESKTATITISPGRSFYYEDALIYKYGFIKGSIIFSNTAYTKGILSLTKEGTEIKTKTITNNADFRFEDITPGKYTITFNGNGYEPITIDITVVKNKEINVGTISPGYILGDLEGKITLPFTEELSNTQIIIKDKNNKIIDTLTTDNNGKFSKKGLTKGEYTLEITKEKYESKTATITISPGRSFYYEDALIYKYGFIKGSIIFSNTAYTKGILSLTKEGTEIKTKTITNNADFRFEDITPGKYTITFNGNGYEPITIDITVVKNKEINVGTINTTYIFGDIQGLIQPMRIDGTKDNIAEKSDFLIKLYDSSNIVIKETTTNTKGEFSIIGVPEGEYLLKVLKENYITKDVVVEVKRNQLTSVNTIEVLPGGEDKGWVKGKVYLEDKSADSNSGIIVVFKREKNTASTLAIKKVDNSKILNKFNKKLPIKLNEENIEYEIIDTAVTDSYGNYSTLLPSGNYVIEFSKDTYESTETKTNVEKGKIIELNPIQLKRKVTKLYGYITLPGNIDNSGAVVDVNGLREVTNKKGYYEIITKVGTYKIKISKENYKLFEEMVSISDESSMLYSKTLEPLKGSIEGFAGYNVENITNQEGITVTLEGTTLDMSLNEQNIFLTTTTDSNGHYVIGNVPFGNYKITFSSQGFTSVTLENIKIMPNQKMVLEQIIKLDEVPNSGSIYGKAYLKDSSDMSGIHVLAKKRNGPGYSTITDKDGSFVFPKVESGIYDIEFSKFSYKTVRIEEVKVEVGKIINLEQTPLLERASGRIIGTIHLQGWNHYENIKVELLGDYEEEIGYRLTTYTATDGTFVLDAPIEQNYNGLKIYKNEDFETYEYKQNFQTTENGTYEAFNGEILTLKALSTTVTGKVTISSGFDSFLNIKVELLSKNSTATYETYTDENGTFMFQHIPIGEYIQKSSFPQCGYVLSEVKVTPAEKIITNDVTLIPNAGQISGYAKLKDMQDSSDISVTLEPFDTNTQKINYFTKTNADGSYIFGSVLAGKYKLRASKEGWNEQIIDEITVEELKETFANQLELVDITPPTLTKILINGGANTTDNAKVIISTFAEDKGSGLGQILISNTSDFSNVTWQNYEFQKIHSVDTQSGIKTVYVKVKDKAGNVSEVKSATIEVVDLPDMTDLIDYLHGRIVEKDVVITKAQSPYYVSDSIKVNEGVTVTIEPGVTLVFKTGMKFIVDGYLVADGSTEEIVFKPENENDTFEIVINGKPVDNKNTLTNLRTKNLKTNILNRNILKEKIQRDIEETISEIGLTPEN